MVTQDPLSSKALQGRPSSVTLANEDGPTNPSSICLELWEYILCKGHVSVFESLLWYIQGNCSERQCGHRLYNGNKRTEDSPYDKDFLW